MVHSALLPKPFLCPLSPSRLPQLHCRRRAVHNRRPLAVPAMASGCPFLAGALGNSPTNVIDVPAKHWTPPPLSEPSSCTAEEYEAIARELAELARSGEGFPKFFRLGFHVSGHYSAQSRDGGPNGGWQQYPIDEESPKNAGLPNTIQAIKELHRKHPKITWADLATLGACVAVEAAGGIVRHLMTLPAGPPVAWYPGRRDALAPGPSHPPYSNRLAVADYSPNGVLDFYTGMGLTMREAVVLNAGGHSMGGADRNASGWDGSFTSYGDCWPMPSNKHLLDLLRYGWTYEVVEETSRLQWVLAPGQEAAYKDGEGKSVFRFPTDMAIRTASAFSYWAVAYARNEAAFVRDFQRAMQRMVQLGARESWEPQTSYKWKGLKGDFEGFGPHITPHLDTEDIPAGAPGAPGSKEHEDFLKNEAKALADPSTPLPASLLL